MLNLVDETLVCKQFLAIRLSYFPEKDLTTHYLDTMTKIEKLKIHGHFRQF